MCIYCGGYHVQNGKYHFNNKMGLHKLMPYTLAVLYKWGNSLVVLKCIILYIIGELRIGGVRFTGIDV